MNFIKKYGFKILIVLIYFAIILRLFYNVFLFKSDWLIIDWLINYEDGGFKRRGLSGSVIFFLQDLFNIKLEIIIFLIIFSLYTYLFYVLYNNIKNLDFRLIIYLLFPFGILYYVHEGIVIGRKEVLLFSAFVFLQTLLKKTRLTNIDIILFALLFNTSLLFHEVVLFFLPYFIYLIYDSAKENRKTFIFFLVVSSTITTGLLLFFGMNLNYGLTEKILSERGLKIGGGVLDYKQTVALKDINLLVLAEYLIIVLFSFYINYLMSSKNKNLFKLYFLSFLFSLPLFFLAVDWGRWIIIHNIMFFLLMFITYKSKINLINNKKTYIGILSIFLFLNFFKVIHHWDNQENIFVVDPLFKFFLNGKIH